MLDFIIYLFGKNLVFVDFFMLLVVKINLLIFE